MEELEREREGGGEQKQGQRERASSSAALGNRVVLPKTRGELLGRESGGKKKWEVKGWRVQCASLW